MDRQELIDWIQLINSNDIGPVTFYKMLDKYGTASESLVYLNTKKDIFPRHLAESELEHAEQRGIHVITKSDPLYPKKFESLNDAPPILYAKGQIRLLNYPVGVAVVGSRNASVNGRKIASKIAYDLTNEDVLIISGLARGIDASAHKGALYACQQTGATIAVLGTGVDVPYPTENTDLYNQIAEQGVIISEYPLGTPAQVNNFPRRNRLVSALSDGVLVIEASLNSGSLITARLGLEQGKDIFAVPGSPLEGRSAGANRLIKDGASLVESADDILEILKMTSQRQIKDYISRDLFQTHLDKPEKNVDSRTENRVTYSASLTTLIPEDGLESDELIRKSGLPTQEAMMKITELEMDGQIERRGSRLFITDRKRK